MRGVKVEMVNAPVFGLVCWEAKGRKLGLYCGGGGSSKTGVGNQLALVDLDDDIKVLSKFDTGDELGSLARRCGESSNDFVVCFGSKLRMFQVMDDAILEKQGSEIVADFHEKEPCVNAMDVAYDGLSLVTGGDDGVVRLWVLEEDDLRRDRDCPGHDAAVTSVAYADAAHLIVSASKDGSCRLWSATLGTCFTIIDVRAVTPIEVPKPRGKRAPPKPGVVMCRSARFTDRDLSVIVASCPNRGAAFASKWALSVVKDEVILDMVTISRVSTNPVSTTAATKDLAAFGDVDGTVTVLSTATLKPVLTKRSVHDLPVTALAFSSDDSLLSASADYKVARITTPSRRSRTKGRSLVDRLFSLIFYALLFYVLYLKGPDASTWISHQLTSSEVAFVVPSFDADPVVDAPPLEEPGLRPGDPLEEPVPPVDVEVNIAGDQLEEPPELEADTGDQGEPDYPDEDNYDDDEPEQDEDILDDPEYPDESPDEDRVSEQDEDRKSVG